MKNPDWFVYRLERQTVIFIRLYLVVVIMQAKQSCKKCNRVL